mmetsp:Transcript_12805/g.30041  ORF Transcript_12805/g.30041 Transcript_12805/m.30041 type:complete len:262 (+) Transcript_12805:150-935(+)
MEPEQEQEHEQEAADVEEAPPEQLDLEEQIPEPPEPHKEAKELRAKASLLTLTHATLPALLHKTKLCRFHAQGRCTKGENCGFAHSLEEIQTAPDFHRTRWCPALLEHKKCENESCPFAHNEAELRDINSAQVGIIDLEVRAMPNFSPTLSEYQKLRMKTQMCKFFEQGLCQKGDECTYAHSPDELRETPPRKNRKAAAPSRQDMAVQCDDTEDDDDDSLDTLDSRVAAGLLWLEALQHWSPCQWPLWASIAFYGCPRGCS